LICQQLAYTLLFILDLAPFHHLLRSRTLLLLFILPSQPGDLPAKSE
jgi:hypothetical protein